MALRLPSWFPFQKKPVPTQARTEVSLRDPQLYPPKSQWFPYNPDVFALRKGGIQVYDKMRRDGQIKSCQAIKKLAVLCSGWDIEPASEDAADVQPADFLRETLIDLSGTLESIIKGILTGWDYGFSITEKVFDYVQDGDFAGKLGIAKLKTRKPHRWDFKTDEYGNLIELWQENGVYKYKPGKFIVFSHNKEFDNWYGTSDLQAVYPHWFSKDVIMRYWNIFLERFGMGIPFLHPDEEGTLSGQPYEDLRDALFNLQANSVLATTMKGAKIDILESGRRGRDEYGQAISYHDRAIARALLMPTGLGYADDERGGGGSYARSKKHFDIWLWVMLDARKTIEELFNEQLVRELVDYNFMVGKHPKFKFNPLKDEDTEALAKLWLEAITGKAVHPNQEDENHLRKQLGFPERDEDELTEEWELEKQAKEEMRQAKLDGLKGQPSTQSPPPPQPGPGGSGSPTGAKVLPFPDKGKEKQMARKWHRELTKVEKRFDFAAAEKALDSLEDETRSRLTSILTKQRDKLKNKIFGTLNQNKMTKQWIRDLKLQYATEFQATVGEYIRSVFDLGRNHASSQVAKARGKEYAEPVIKLPPKQAIERLMQDRFWIKNVVYDSLVKDIQSILIQGLDTGELPAETLQKIEAAYEPYIGDKQKVIDQKQIEPYRIETLIRTNGTRAYNTGMMVEYNDPDLDGFVRAVQLSAILDTRTTDICRHADGKIFMLDDPEAGRLTPPLHFNCRSVLIPITEVDGEFTPSKTVELTQVRQLMPKDFGGTVDKA